MRVLLTGSTGFIGRHLVPILDRAGHDIIRLVRTARGGGHEIVWDGRDPLPELPACNAVVHLAARVDVEVPLDLALLRANVVSTMRLAACARRRGAHFIFASTASIHGNIPIINATMPIAPVSGYAMSKYLAEEVVRTSVDRYSILRIGGIYGLDGPAHLGVNTAISRAYHASEVPVLCGSGKVRRNYICVEDVARWVEAVLVRVGARGACQEVLYLAGPETLTIVEYLETIAKILLPNVPVQRVGGAESSDCVIEPSDVPFPLTTFASYVMTLQRVRMVSGVIPA